MTVMSEGPCNLTNLSLTGSEIPIDNFKTRWQVRAWQLARSGLVTVSTL